MKKRFVCLPLFLLFTILQAGPKRKNINFSQETTFNSTGSNQQLPVGTDVPTEEVTASACANSTDLFLEQTDAFEHQQSSRRFSQHSESESSLDHDAAWADPSHQPEPNAHVAACQTTMNHFTRQTPPSLIKVQSSRASENDLEQVEYAEVLQLQREHEQQIVQKQRTILEAAMQTLEEIGALKAAEKTFDFGCNIVQTRLQRILSLDKSLKLRTRLETFETEADQGEWLAKGLSQAVEQKNIDAVTRMLEIIQNHGLTNFVPTQHQEDAAQLLLQHTRKITSHILPQAQRISNPGDVSPRSKAAQTTLQAIIQAYGHDPEEDQHISGIIATLKQLKPKPRASSAIEND